MEKENKGNDYDGRKPTDRELLWETHQAVSEIRQAIYGNEKNDQDGLIAKVKKHGEYIQKDKRFKLIGLGALVGLNGIWEVIKNKIGL